jgi:hypothetical protein
VNFSLQQRLFADKGSLASHKLEASINSVCKLMLCCVSVRCQPSTSHVSPRGRLVTPPHCQNTSSGCYFGLHCSFLISLNTFLIQRADGRPRIPVRWGTRASCAVLAYAGRNEGSFSFSAIISMNKPAPLDALQQTPPSAGCWYTSKCQTVLRQEVPPNTKTNPCQQRPIHPSTLAFKGSLLNGYLRIRKASDSSDGVGLSTVSLPRPSLSSIPLSC